jgi:hypothetical protein
MIDCKIGNCHPVPGHIERALWYNWMVELSSWLLEMRSMVDVLKLLER